MEILDAINRLDDHVHQAPEIPLTDSIRMEPELLQASMGVIRHHADGVWGADREGPIGDLFTALEKLEAMVAAAKPWPLAGQVRVNRDELYTHLDRIRELLPQAVTRAGGASAPWTPVVGGVEAIEALMDKAGHALLSRALKIDARELRDAAARLRVTATQNLGPHDGHDGPTSTLYAALDELDRLASGEGTLKVSHGELHGLVQRMWAASLEGAALNRSG